MMLATALKKLFVPVTATGSPVIGAKKYQDLQVVDPSGVAAFEACTFTNMRFEASRGHKATIAGSSFTKCVIHDCYFGPATLDLGGTTFRECELRDVEFMLGKLSRSSFSQSRLVNVTFRSADLRGASFTNATLKRVCFERATLVDADFTGVKLIAGDFWGEPPWHGAVVADEVRYSFGIVRDPLIGLDRAAESGAFSDHECQAIRAIHDWLQGWAPDAPEVMLLHREVAHLADLPLFTRILKQLKGDA